MAKPTGRALPGDGTCSALQERGGETPSRGTAIAAGGLSMGDTRAALATEPADPAEPPGGGGLRAAGPSRPNAG